MKDLKHFDIMPAHGDVFKWVKRQGTRRLNVPRYADWPGSRRDEVQVSERISLSST
jgi:hypothetical protein